MTRDYLTYELQEVQSQIENLYTQEQAVEEAKQAKDRQRQRDAERDAERARKTLLRETQSPSAVYQFLATTEKANATAFRNEWQSNSLRVECLREAVKGYYQANFEAPKIDNSVLSALPAYSFVLQFSFTLAQPYISRDEQDFYIIDNPIRKDKVFDLPYVASTSWKGSLRAALWHLNHGPKDVAVTHLFGNEKEAEDQGLFRAGRLYFFPTFFTQKSLEIINPQDRKLRAGEKPITFESVPGGLKGATGSFTLLYVPFDRIGEDEKETRNQVAQELNLVAIGLQAMFRDYGFGAKTSSGFGVAKETIPGSLILRMPGDGEQRQEEETPITQPVESALARYLEAPNRLKPEYLTPEGTFRERSEAELKKINRSDRQLYDKAKSWWEREGKQLAEAAKLPKPVEPALPETLSQAKPLSWPKWPFDSFEKLLECAEEVANKLFNGGWHEQ